MSDSRLIKICTDCANAINNNNFDSDELINVACLEILSSFPVIRNVPNNLLFIVGRNAILRFIKNERKQQHLSLNNLAELQDKSNNQTINNIPDLQKLTSLEKQIIYRKYWRNNTHRQLADYFGKSNTTIQNILESALNKLKEN